MRLRIAIKRGVITGGREELKGLIGSLPDGEYILQLTSLADPHSKEEWRHLYFFLRDILHESVETGYTKKELHDAIKNKVIHEMWLNNNGAWFERDELPHISTQFLTEVGWREYVGRFKEFSMDTYEVYI